MKRGPIAIVVPAYNAHPNRSLALAGIGLIVVRWIFMFVTVLALQLFWPEDPEQYFRIGPYANQRSFIDNYQYAGMNLASGDAAVTNGDNAF
jgi:hypothetical protein